MAKNTLKRISADFSPEAVEVLERVAGMLKTNKSDALRRSLGLIDFILTEQKEGNHIIIEDTHKHERKRIVTV